MHAPEELIPVGKVVGTHGIMGLLKVHSYSGNLDSLRSARLISLKTPDGMMKEIGVNSVTPHSGRLLIRLEGYNDINSAHAFVGSEICLKRDQFPEPDADEYYWCDLIGLRVVTVQGETLGLLTSIFETGSNDVYVVTGDTGKEFLIPAIADVVHEVDLSDGRMVITPLEGLLDL